MEGDFIVILQKRYVLRDDVRNFCCGDTANDLNVATSELWQEPELTAFEEIAHSNPPSGIVENKIQIHVARNFLLDHSDKGNAAGT
jgi:hypothetical protein